MLLVSVLMLTCQPPSFGKSDFDQNYVYGIPEATILTIILLSSILCKYFFNDSLLLNIIIQYFNYSRHYCLFGFTSTSKAQIKYTNSLFKIHK